jgi:hypothetical protein
MAAFVGYLERQAAYNPEQFLDDEHEATGEEDEEMDTGDGEEGNEGEEGEEEEEEEEYVEEEEGEDGEEYEESDDGSESTSSKRQRTGDPKDDRIHKLESDNEVLRRENKELKEKVIPQLLKIQQGQQEMVRCFSAFAGISSGLVTGRSSISAAADASQGVRLEQIFVADGAEYGSIDDISVPQIFSSAGSFPHAVLVDRKTRERVNEVVMTRRLIMRFRLVYKLDGRKVTENTLCEDGNLPFKMTIRYAHNDEVVRTGDFDKFSSGDITEPERHLMDVQHMVGGEVTFRFKFKVTSTDAKPRNSPFVIKVAPEHPDFEGNNDLKVITPPFVVRTKASRTRAQCAAAAAAENAPPAAAGT